MVGLHWAPLLLPRERWNPYWSPVWIFDQSPQIRPQGWSREKRVTKDISLTMSYVLITTWEGVGGCVMWAASQLFGQRGSSADSPLKGKIASDCWGVRVCGQLGEVADPLTKTTPILQVTSGSLLWLPVIELNKWFRFQWQLPRPSALCLARAAADLINF